jgi:hypothetical protein
MNETRKMGKTALKNFNLLFCERPNMTCILISVGLQICMHMFREYVYMVHRVHIICTYSM